MRGFLLFISIINITNVFADSLKANKDSIYKFSIGAGITQLSGNSHLKNYDSYSIRENGDGFSDKIEIFQQKYAKSATLGNGMVAPYPTEIIRKNIKQLYSFSLTWQKKNTVFKIKLNSFQRDFTHIHPKNNGFSQVIDNYKNQSIYGNYCDVSRYNSNILEIPVTYGIGFNKKYFIGNVNIGLNNSFLTKEQTYHHRVVYDNKTKIYYDEGLKYLESDKMRFYKTNLTTSAEIGFILFQTIGFTLNGTYDFRPIWQTKKSLEIIRYSKSMAGFSLYYYL